MKKYLSFFLALILLACLLSAGAAAAGPEVMLSRQGLRADGKTIACEKYNIDGSNYFKLRDIAWLVNGTGSQFSVGYDEVRKTVSIVTGAEYVPNGSEMDLSGGDKSATAVPSAQTVLIDGATSAYTTSAATTTSSSGIWGRRWVSRSTTTQPPTPPSSSARWLPRRRNG